MRTDGRDMSESNTGTDEPRIKPGDFVTVRKVYSREYDASYVGDCLEVLVVDEDLFVCKVRGYASGSYNTREVTLNQARYCIRKLSQEFIDHTLARERVAEHKQIEADADREHELDQLKQANKSWLEKVWGPRC